MRSRNNRFAIISAAALCALITMMAWSSRKPEPVVTPADLFREGMNCDFRPSTQVPHIIHQSWKTTDLPEKFRTWQQTWKTLHPTWKYILWTDADNRRLIATHYPWFLRYYDALPSNITRADASRYFYMHRYGGIYVDLDSECLKPFDTLLSDAPAYVATMTGNPSWDHDIPNAWVASRREHPFWLFVVAQIMGFLDGKGDGGAEAVTGPIALIKAWRAYNADVPEEEREPVKLLEKGIIYPYAWINPPREQWTCWGGQSNGDFNPETCKIAVNATGKPDEKAHMITYWTHTWNNEDK